MAMKLNLGCGMKKLPGYHNSDFNADFGPDSVVNLDQYPWPWKDDSCEEVVIEHALEHLADPYKAVSELYRITKPGGKIIVKVPHYSIGGNHWGHKTFWSVDAFTLEPACRVVDGKLVPLFKVNKKRLKWLRYGPFQRKIYYWTFPFSWLVDILANVSPSFTERFFAYTWGGFEEVHLELEPDKPAAKP